ncbi:MAG TPA: hypothetical protein VJZ76_12375 [Thermoanaerobaculia bacterium]|nr:hypothetical protein [Thermoanaerobaculia bacterium]
MTLTDARLQLHWAAQLAATVGRTLAPPRADDSHTSFRWVNGALVQEDEFRSGLRLHDLTLLLGDREFALDGRTIDDGFAWLQSQLPGLRREFNEPMPHHAVADGAPFSLNDRAAFEELSRCYAEAARLLRPIHDDVRAWPHHFDIATLLEFDGGRSIGAGLSPGDASCDEPYWYVNHTPATSRRDFPPLAGGGTWTTDGWVGAMLPVSRGGDAQAFLDSAIAASRMMIGEHA